MKRILTITSLVIIFHFSLSAQKHQVVSPNGRLIVNVEINKGVSYSVTKDGEVVVRPSQINMITNLFDENVFDSSSASQTQNVQVLRPLWGVSAKIPNDYKQLVLRSTNKVSLELRAYNDGFAWRYITYFEEDLIVLNEKATFSLPEESTVYFPETNGFSTPFESNYIPTKLSEIKPKTLGLTPLLYKTPSGKAVAISESNLFQYPGMFIEKLNATELNAVFPEVPKRESQQLLGRLKMVKRPQLSKLVVRSTEKYLAKTVGKRFFPWRVIMVANSDVEMLNNNLVFQLADIPSGDFSWVKPGKVVCDWYHSWNLQGVDFKPGINTQTYKYMIDFAAQNGIQYINIDEGWSKLWSFNRINPKLNLPEVISYANQKNVGVFIWTMWNTLDKDLTSNLDMFQKMGVAGLKVDFINRCDQRVVDFVNTLAIECATRKLLLNLHGMYKPTGISHTYPNVVNIEGVLGLEYNKFSNKCTPDHNLTIPFIRNIVGPMDYTPGAMRYMQQAEFKKSWDNPHAMTTRAHQLAMYVVYHGGVQMLADSPTLFEEDEIVMDFLSAVPVSWDYTIPIAGKIGEVVVIARRSGEKWFIGGMAGDENQKVSFDFGFLGEREYKMTLITDGQSSYDLIKEDYNISRNNTFTYEIKKTGGFVLIIE